MKRIFIKIFSILGILGIFLSQQVNLNIATAQVPAPELGLCRYRTRIFIAAGRNESFGELKFQNIKDKYTNLFQKNGIVAGVGDIQEFYSATDLKRKIQGKNWQYCGPNQEYQDRLLIFLFGHGDYNTSVSIYNPSSIYRNINYTAQIKADEVYDILDQNFIVSGAQGVLQPLAIPVYITIFACHAGSWHNSTYQALNEKGLSVSLYVSSSMAEFTWGTNFAYSFWDGMNERLESLRDLRKNSINSVRDLDAFIFQNGLNRARVNLLSWLFNPTILVPDVPKPILSKPTILKLRGELMYSTPQAYGAPLPAGYASEDRVVFP